MDFNKIQKQKLSSVQIVTLSLATLFFVCAVIYSASYNFLNHDVAIYLHSGMLILKGYLPYIDIVDTNPPMIMYLSTIPVLIKDLLGTSLVLSLDLSFLALFTWSSVTVLFLIRQIDIINKGIGLFYSIWLTANIMMFFQNEIAQREHIYVLTSIPYLILRTFNTNDEIAISRFQRIVIGLMCALGTSLKHYFFLPVAIVEVYNLIYKKDYFKRPVFFGQLEVFGFLVAVFLYIGIFLISGECRDNYFFWIAPLISKGYKVYNQDYALLWMIYNPLFFNRSKIALFELIVYFLFIGNCFFTLFFKSLWKKENIVFILISLSMLFIYYHQHKGWHYQIIPFFIFSLISIYTAFSFFTQEKVSWVFRNISSQSLSCIISVISIIALFSFCSGPYLKAENKITNLLGLLPKDNNKIAIVSTSLLAYPGLAINDKLPGTRFLCYFPIALLYSNINQKMAEQDIFKTGSIDPITENKVNQMIKSDLLKNKPDAIIFLKATTDQALPLNFNLYNYFQYHSLLPPGDLYQQITDKKGQFSEFIILLRKDLWAADLAL